MLIYSHNFETCVVIACDVVSTFHITYNVRTRGFGKPLVYFAKNLQVRFCLTFAIVFYVGQN
jgi:hypothetical protein